MSLAKNIRDQLLKSFRAELAEHIQTMTDGLLAMEQAFGQGQQPDSNMMDTTFRAAHSLKGASRAMGVTAIEQLAHSLESILDGLRRGTMGSGPELFTICYQALDTIQVVQTAYEAGETTPPMQALMTLAELERVRKSLENKAPGDSAASVPAAAVTQPAETQPAAVTQPAEKPAEEPFAQAVSAPVEAQPAAVSQPVAVPQAVAAQPVEQPVAVAQPVPAAVNGGGQPAAEPAGPEMPVHTEAVRTLGDETIRVDVQKLDALMANLSELLVARIRLEQRQQQLTALQKQLGALQRTWSPVRGAYNRMSREQEHGLLSLHRPRSVDAFPHDKEGRSNNNGFANAAHPMLRGENEMVFGDIKALTELGKDASMLLRYVNTSQEQLREIQAQVADLARLYGSDTMHLSMVIDEMETEIKRLRMLPFSTITNTFARMVRDLSRQSGKEVALTVLGGDTEVDKRILEGIKDPLTHLLRNAIDHGLEKPEKRLAAGKARTGQITVSAEQIGKEVVVRVSDDGSGLDMEAIRQAAMRQMDPKRGGDRDPRTMSDPELIETIFSLGVSTSRMITDVSGRGIGLNVVRNNIETLHGRIDVESQLGEGTTFTLVLPLAMTGSRGLFVRAGGQIFALPINNVERTLNLKPGDIFTLEGHDAIQYGGQPVTVVRLSDVLEMPGSVEQPLGSTKEMAAVVLTSNERYSGQQSSRDFSRQMAFIIDELVGEQEVVIKELGKQLVRVVGISGATVMGSGEVVLVLNASDLMKLATRRARHSVLEMLQSKIVPALEQVRKRILVVDDSITTRTLEKNILEAAGYQVWIATDGYEALELIRTSERPDLVVTDIVMPRMDGFELTRQIKHDEKTADLPVILVTSLDSAEDKERGIEVQADAYIVKSSFDQVNLLETIEQLI